MKKISKFESLERNALKHIQGGGAVIYRSNSCPARCRNTPGNGCVRSGCVCLGSAGASGFCVY